MNEHEWRSERDSRSLRYAGRVLNPERWITLRADPSYAARYDGQVAILTAANLLGRMSPAVALDIPQVPMVPPCLGLAPLFQRLFLIGFSKPTPMESSAAARRGNVTTSIHLGKTGAASLVHGSGWNIYSGRGPSPLVDDETVNPIGPAMAAILAASEAFRTKFSNAGSRNLLQCPRLAVKCLGSRISPRYHSYRTHLVNYGQWVQARWAPPLFIS